MSVTNEVMDRLEEFAEEAIASAMEDEDFQFAYLEILRPGSKKPLYDATVEIVTSESCEKEVYTEGYFDSKSDVREGDEVIVTVFEDGTRSDVRFRNRVQV